MPIEVTMTGEKEKELFEAEVADQFGQLEAKVIELVHQLTQVRKEKEELALSNRDLHEEILRQEEEIKRLKDTLEGMKKKQELTYTKVKNLIDRIEAVS